MFIIRQTNTMRLTFDDTFKADNHILSMVLKANGMISWLMRNFISRETWFKSV